MSNPTPGVKITLDKERTLRCGNRALMAIEEATGKNILAGELGTPTYTETMVMVWAALLHEDPTLALDEFIDLFEPQRLTELSAAFTEAFAQAFPDAVEGQESGKAKRPRKKATAG